MALFSRKAISAKIICATLLVTSFLSANTAAASMADAVNRFASSAAMRKANIGICVMDISTGQVVAAKDVDKKIIPASVMKIITSASALKSLSPQYRFRTMVSHDGYIDYRGVLNGNLIIDGGIDPTLESRYFPQHQSFLAECVKQLQRRGVKRITGKIIVNEHACPDSPVPNGWMDSDIAYFYGAGVHALNYSDNLCSLVIDVDGPHARVIDTIPYQRSLKISNRIRLGKGKGYRYKPSVFRKKNTNTLHLGGRVARGARNVEVRTTMPNPAEALVYDLEATLKGNGIAVGGRALAGKRFTTTLFNYYSPTLDEVVKSLLTRSDNTYAEAVLRIMALRGDTAATRKYAIDRERRVLASWGVNLGGQKIYDGSGLSRDNRISARFLADVLLLAARNPQIEAKVPSLFPVAGRDGTVKSLLRGTRLSGRIALKSGSMTGVQCYAGYYPAKAPRYAVVMMVNRYRCNYGQLRRSIEQLFTGLFAN